MPIDQTLPLYVPLLAIAHGFKKLALNFLCE